MSVPAVSLPSPIDETTSYNIPRPSPRPSAITTTATDEGMMSIPAGETPESTGDMTNTAQSSSSTPSSTKSAAPEASTAAASFLLKHDGTQYRFALGVSAVSVLFGAAYTLF
jgi:hypothetical protein